MADPAPLSAVLDCLTSIERQRHDTLVATILSTDAATRAAVEMRASVAPGRFLPPSAVPTCSGLNALHAVLHTSELADVEWMAVAIEPVLLEPEAAGWLAALAASGTVIGAFADEDTVLMPGDRTARVQAIYTDPQLKGAADPELLDQGQDLGSLIVVHRKALIGAIEELAIAGSREGNDVRPGGWSFIANWSQKARLSIYSTCLVAGSYRWYRRAWLFRPRTSHYRGLAAKRMQQRQSMQKMLSALWC